MATLRDEILQKREKKNEIFRNKTLEKYKDVLQTLVTAYSTSISSALVDSDQWYDIMEFYRYFNEEEFAYVTKLEPVKIDGLFVSIKQNENKSWRLQVTM